MPARCCDLSCEPVGQGSGGRDVYLADFWPGSEEIHALMQFVMNGLAYQKSYGRIATEPGARW